MVLTEFFDTLDLLPKPEPRGFTVRNWQENADYDRMSAVLIASRNADALEEALTGDNLRHMYENTPNFDPTRNLLLIEHHGELIGYAGCRWWQELSGEFMYAHWLYMLPERRGQGIENQLLHSVQDQQRIQAHANSSTAKHWFYSVVADSQPWLQNVLESDGYSPTRYFYDMVCSDLSNIPEFSLPQGIETRLVTEEQYRKIWEAEVEAFTDHWGARASTEADYQRWLDSQLTNPALWQVAWDGDQVVGMVRNFVDENENQRYGYLRGYTEDISVRKPWRKRGIARALLVKSIKMFHEMGCDHTALNVDTENPTGALRVYESVGYKTVRRTTVFRKPV